MWFYVIWLIWLLSLTGSNHITQSQLMASLFFINEKNNEFLCIT